MKAFVKQELRSGTARSAWQRLCASGRTRFCLLSFSLVTTICLLTLPVTTRWYNVQALDVAVRSAPTFRPILSINRFNEAAPGSTDASQYRSIVGSALHAVSSWAGHDNLGRSLLLRLMPGFLVSMLVGLVAAGTALVIGTLWGSLAAMSGGAVDSFMMRIVDVLYSLPYVLTVILLRVALMQPLHRLFPASQSVVDVAVLTLAIGGVSWLTVARVVRGQVLSLRQQVYVDAARASGAGGWHIFRRHLIPNLVGPLTAATALVVPQAVLQESFLSFLGIGIQQPTPSLGRLAADGVEAVNVFVSYWWLLVFPCATLVLTLAGLNFITDSLRDALDPKSASNR